MKLKDYPMPQYGLDDGLDQGDLEQYSLKNFDLKAYQLTETQLDPAPIPAAPAPYLLEPQADSPIPVAAAVAAPSPDQIDPTPVETAPYQPALDSYDVQFGAHFNLQTVSFTPLSPAQSWKIPRWVVGMVGLFFGAAALLTISFCVVLLRDPTPAPTAQVAAPTAPVATTPAAPPASSAPMNKAPVAVTRAPSAPDHETTTKPAPADRRIVVSRHPSVVRRQVYVPRRVASKSPSSSVASQEVETASRPPPKDALDQLLGESSL